MDEDETPVVIEHHSEYKDVLYCYVALLHQWGYCDEEGLDFADFLAIRAETEYRLKLMETCHKLLIEFTNRREVFLAAENSSPNPACTRGICSPVPSHEIRRVEDAIKRVFGQQARASTAWPNPSFNEAELTELSYRRMRRDMLDLKAYFDDEIQRARVLDIAPPTS